MEIAKNNCRFFHTWSKWKEIERGERIRSGTNDVLGRYLIQERECQVCGYKQLKQENS